MFNWIRWLITGSILTVAVALAVFAGAGLVAWPSAGPLARPAFSILGQEAAFRVAPGAALKEENCYMCGDAELVFQGQAPPDMLGRDLRYLRGKYPEKDGWSVDLESEKLVVIRKNVDGFCGRHSLYRHLGTHRDMLAVFQGPLGFDQRLIRVEARKVESLPPSLREKLQKARDFNRLTAADRASLRPDLEFADENLLNSALENLDEIPETAGLSLR